MIGHPLRHWELDDQDQPTQRIIESRRAGVIIPTPKPTKRKASAEQAFLAFDEGKGIATAEQRYDHTAVINPVRQQVDQWRRLPNSNDWRVTFGNGSAGVLLLPDGRADTSNTASNDV